MKRTFPSLNPDKMAFSGKLQIFFKLVDRLYVYLLDDRRIAGDEEGKLRCHYLDESATVVVEELRAKGYVPALPLDMETLPACYRRTITLTVDALYCASRDIITDASFVEAKLAMRARLLKALRAQALQATLLMKDCHAELSANNVAGIRSNVEALLTERPALRPTLIDQLRASRWPEIAAIGHHLKLEAMVVRTPGAVTAPPSARRGMTL